VKTRLMRHNGVLHIDIDGRLYAPLAFRSFRPTPRTIAAFYDAGVRLMSILHTGLDCTLAVPYSNYGEHWLGPDQYDLDAIARKMDLFLTHAPEARLNIMLQLDTRDWYLKNRPEVSNTFLNLVETAGDETWRNDVTRYLEAILPHFESRWGDRIFAYSLFCGGSTEWYTNSQAFGNPEGEIRPHRRKEQSFRDWTGDPRASLPSMDELQRCSAGGFRDPVADAEALRYWRFHNEIIGETIVHFAGQAKRILDRKKLLGVYCGYLLELTETRLLHEGQLGYRRVWDCSDLDLLLAPAAYGYARTFEGPSGFLHTVDSLELRNKLYFHEMDHTTHIAPSHVESGRPIPGADSRADDEFTSRAIFRREFALTACKRLGRWWFDFFGGYYDTPGLMDEVRLGVAAAKRIGRLPMQNTAQVALFGDVESMYYVNEQTTLARNSLRNLRDSLMRIGAPVDFFNLEDIHHPTVDRREYRLIVLPNAYAIDERTLRRVRQRARAGASILWLYAPGIIHKNQIEPGHIAEVVGMQIAPLDPAETHARTLPEHILADLPPAEFGFDDLPGPAFHVTDPAAIPLGRWNQSGTVALACKPGEAANTFYSAAGKLCPGVLRAFARQAGVHIYLETDDPLYANSHLLGVHVPREEEVTVRLPCDAEFEDLFTGEIVRSSQRRLRYRSDRQARLLAVRGQTS
jgi:beta-galactosidase